MCEIYLLGIYIFIDICFRIALINEIKKYVLHYVQLWVVKKWWVWDRFEKSDTVIKGTMVKGNGQLVIISD